MTPRDDNSTKAGGWSVIVAYALVCAATQVLWLTYAAAGAAMVALGGLLRLGGETFSEAAAGGLLVALLVQVLVHHPLAAFLAMAGVSLLGLPLAARLTSPAAEGRGGSPAPVAAG
jgi:Na+-transporting methylmalonyl-CoA/oxaloacetate decarboxylase beta subunit